MPTELLTLPSAATLCLSQNRKLCPTCNNKAKASDVRVLYAASHSLADTSQLAAAQELLEEEKRKRVKVCELIYLKRIVEPA
jgi:hypothetical protein